MERREMQRDRSPLAVRLLSIPVVVVVVLAGLWVSGGVITNDFTVAMVLTAVWMALAGGVAVAVALRRRDLRWPVLGAYLVTALVAGAYLTSSTLFDDEVDEKVATAGPAAPAARGEERSARTRNVELASGRFESVRHPARGEAAAIRLGEGGRVLTLTGFEVDNGPDLRVYLAAGPATTEGEVDDFVDLGGLKGSSGNQQYVIPPETDLGRYTTVVVWCRAFSVLFARAPLRS